MSILFILAMANGIQVGRGIKEAVQNAVIQRSVPSTQRPPPALRLRRAGRFT